MVTIDPRLIVLSANFIAIFCSLILFIMHRSYPRAIGGLWQWLWSCFVTMLASMLLLARGVIPPIFSIVLGNVLVALLIMLMYAGIRRFTGRTVGYRAMIAVLAGLTLLWTWIAFSEDYSRYGILLSSFVNMVLFGACAFATAAVRSGAGQANIASQFTCGVFVLATFILCVRFFSALFRIDVPTDLFDTSLVHKIYLSSYPVTFLAATFGFMLMTNNRLRDILLDMNRTLEDAVAERTADLQLGIERTKRLEREAANITENERRRIGRELHDDLGQQLTGISLSAEALADLLNTVAPELSSHAYALERAASEAIIKVRGLAHGLMPVGPGSEGLRDALSHLAGSVSTLSNVACTFDYDDPVDIDDENVAANLFRISQESLTNAIRHSRATSVLLRLDEFNGKVSLSITDNGIGFKLEESEMKNAACARGAGLRIMAFRAFLINYALTIESAPGHGTTIRVTEC